LAQRRRPLPPLRVEIRAAQGAARRKRSDALAALGAIAWVHGQEDGLESS
jgi:hypothetical protein